MKFKYSIFTNLNCFCIKIRLLKKRQKKAHIAEIQLNGGTIADKVKWAKENLEKPISLSDVFQQDELIDIIGVTQGKGMKGKVHFSPSPTLKDGFHII